MTPSALRGAGLRAYAALRPLRVHAILVVAYLILRITFDALTEHGGLLTPAGSIRAVLALVGIAVLLLRLVVLFVLPAVLAYQVVMRLLDRAARRSLRSDVS